ncbi:hypothetical protein N9E48_06460 [Paracoccaceae bacterium]|nr:hypothetical protein [Paracoccaceae bacterium]
MGGNEKVDDGAVSNTLLDEHGSTVINGGEASESSIPDEVGAITLKKGGEAAFPAIYIRY